jgi:hypothetical protein
MTDLNCHAPRQRLEDLLDGYLAADEAAALERHIAGCAACAARHRAATQLRAALRAMPVPEPRPGFADSALAAATRAAARPPQPAPRTARPRWSLASWRRLELWAGATVGAAAAAALAVVLLGVPERDGLEPEPAGVRLALYEMREIGLAIDAPTPMPGAMLTVRLEGGIDIVGLGERRELSWQTDLDAGTNVLTLPIIAHSLEDGRLTALVAHGDRQQRLDFKVQVQQARAD